MSTYKGLTKKGFQAWLAEKGEDEVIGYTMDNCDCPIARHLKEKGVMAQVNEDIIKIYNDKADRKVFDLPLWAKDFVALLDVNGSGNKVTGYTARQLLSNL